MTGATAWEEDIPRMKIELQVDGTLLLTSPDAFGNGDDMVQVHPIQLRLMAEKLGLVGALTDSEAQALRSVDKLARRVRVLHGRIKQLHEWIWSNTNFDQRDIDIEAWYLDATLDLANEFLTEIDESGVVETARGAIGVRSARDQGAIGRPSGADAPKASPTAPPSVEPTGNPVDNPAETHGVSAKACANPSGKALAKASVKPSDKGTEPLFGGDHE